MSRSNPSDHIPNPSTRFFEWDGSNGVIRYFDKEKPDPTDPKKKGANVTIGDNFVFLVLDETSTVRGWSDAHDCGIFANEVRDVTSEVMVVRTFKNAPIATGFYSQIKDRVNAAGGNFTANIYIAFKPAKDAPLAIAGLQLKGAALNAWVDFRKANRKAVYEKAIHIKGSNEGKKGKIVFKTPIFNVRDVSPETDAEAKKLDQELQAYLKAYFSKKKVDQVAQPAHAPADDGQDPTQNFPTGRGGTPPPDDGPPPPDDADAPPPPEDDDVPF